MNMVNYKILRIRMRIRRALSSIIPFLAKTTKIFKKPIVKAYKDSEGWFISDSNGFSKAQNQLIGGVPELIEHFVGASTKIMIKYSSVKFQDAITCDLIETRPSGSTYRYHEGNVDYKFWLCPVFFWYFKNPPKTLFVLIVDDC